MQGATTYTYTVTDGDTANPDSAELTLTIAVTDNAVPDFCARTVSDKTYAKGVQITNLVLPQATGGDGTLRYTLTDPGGGALPAGLLFDAATRTLSGTPTGSQAATTYTWTATDRDGETATLTSAITVAEDPRRGQVRDAVESTLAAVARRTMAGALDTTKARMGEVGASGLSLAGQWVALEGVEAANGLRPCAAERLGGLATPDCAGAARRRSMEAGELLGANAFSLYRGAAQGGASDPATPLWSVWGRGDLATFAGRGEASLGYDGELRTGWLGVDARAGRWVAGVAVSHGEGEGFGVSFCHAGWLTLRSRMARARRTMPSPAAACRGGAAWRRC